MSLTISQDFAIIAGSEVTRQPIVEFDSLEFHQQLHHHPVHPAPTPTNQIMSDHHQHLLTRDSMVRGTILAEYQEVPMEMLSPALIQAKAVTRLVMLEMR
jgi:hypothetical protein